MQVLAQRAEAFCRTMMHELEDQWTRARGHQERHPLKEKMRQLAWITEQVAGTQQIGTHLDAVRRAGGE